ncbi:MAG: uncharacterized protein A8A55_2316 [Amphiamblys sp. WSBS2006]|nr:MAG: uncharacterized protein A8A55_2316 [Amphiamblys sp. WSBS2006]
MMVSVLKTKRAEETPRAFAKLFGQVGSLRLLHTDNGTELKNEAVAGLCAKYGTRQRHGGPRHPQSQGQVERANQTLKRKLRAAVAITATPGRWIGCLHGAVAGYNRCVHITTRAQPLEVFGDLGKPHRPGRGVCVGRGRRRIKALRCTEPGIYSAAKENSQKEYRRVRDEDVFQSGKKHGKSSLDDRDVWSKHASAMWD